MNYSIVKKHSSTSASAKPSGSIRHYLGSINYCTSTVATFHYAVMLYKCWPAPGIILAFHSFSPSITDLSLFEVVLDDSIWHCYVKSRLIPFFFYPFKSIQPWIITTGFIWNPFYLIAMQSKIREFGWSWKRQLNLLNLVAWYIRRFDGACQEMDVTFTKFVNCEVH